MPGNQEVHEGVDVESMAPHSFSSFVLGNFVYSRGRKIYIHLKKRRSHGVAFMWAK
jgi:hypothetical protein